MDFAVLELYKLLKSSLAMHALLIISICAGLKEISDYVVEHQLCVYMSLYHTMAW